MNTLLLEQYPQLQSTISASLKPLFIKGPTSKRTISLANQTYWLFAVLVDIQEMSNTYIANYAGVDILNDEGCLNTQFRLSVGMCYAELNASSLHKYYIAKTFEHFFLNIANKASHRLRKIQIQTIRESNDVLQCIKEYKVLTKNPNKYKLYKGWTVQSQEGFILEINLSKSEFYYGITFTQKVHKVLSDFALTRKSNTLKNDLIRFYKLLNAFTFQMPTLNTFNALMSFNLQHETMQSVYHYMLSEAIKMELDIKNFHDEWKTIVNMFKKVFVESNIVEESLIDIITPHYKSSIINPIRENEHNVPPNAFSTKLVTPIPLHITDTETIEIILDSIQRDVAHVVYCSEKALKRTMKALDVRDEHLKTGSVRDKKRYGSKSNPIPVGIEYPANTVATWHHYLYDSPRNSGYLNFLKFRGKAYELAEILCLPTYQVLYPILTLLVREHPQITPQWLINWELKSKKGEKSGYFQSGDKWLIKSYKERRGKNLAEQTIQLNEKSKYYIDCLLRVTQVCRGYLDRKKDDDARFMLITTPSPNKKPSRLKNFYNPSDTNKDLVIKKVREIYQNPSFMKDGLLNRSKSEGQGISQTLSLRALRKSCGVLVYFETESVHAMAEALGHKKYEPTLIDCYLPPQIWNYFTHRWVRQFQNAIIYEAMKDSRYFFNAMDITEEQLDTFIKNHGLGDLPKNIIRGKELSKDLTRDNITPFNQSDVAVYSISTALLQVFISLVDIVENHSESKNITKVAQRWYESAKFILSHLELNSNKDNGRLNISNNVMQLYEKAKSNPLNIALLERVITC